MKARLLENRPAYGKASDCLCTVKAGEVVDIIRIARYSDRMTAEYKGLYTLSITPEQADPLDDE